MNFIEQTDVTVVAVFDTMLTLGDDNTGIK